MATPPMTPEMALPNKAYLLPEAIAMWPPVWWSWLVLAMLILLLATLMYFLWRRQQSRRYRREALATLQEAQHSLSNRDAIILCHELIRRCLITENKAKLAAQPAADLFAQLDQQGKPKKCFADLSADFIDGPYRPHLELTQAQRNAILATTAYWIRSHHA